MIFRSGHMKSGHKKSGHMKKDQKYLVGLDYF